MKNRIFRCLLAVFLLLAARPVSAQAPAPHSPPYLVRDINTRASDSSKLSGLMEYQGLAYYFAAIPGGQPALWKSDGTPAHTVKVKDGLLGGTGSVGDGNDWMVFNGILYFKASDLSTGEELWRTDGTAQGTFQMADLAPGEPSASPTGFVVYGGGLYFAANGRLWRVVDGPAVEPVTGAGVQVDALTPVIYQGLLYFGASDPVSGGQLWRSDGTPAGTHPAFLKMPGGYRTVDPLLAAGGWLYLALSDGAQAEGGRGLELWVTDGTLAGTRLFADINPSGDSAPNGMLPFYAGLIFTADDGTHGREVWWTPGMRVDGQPAAPSLLADLLPGSATSYPAFVGVVGSRFLFFARDADNAGALWTLAGAPPAPQRIHDASPILNYQFFSAAYQVTPVTARDGDRIFYASFDPASGRELWVTDGTTAGTRLAADIWPGPKDSYPYAFAHCGTALCFPADDGEHGFELWRSDGTPAGTALVYDLNTTRPGSSPQDLTAAGGLVYFTANDGIHGRELWRTDGTQAGTVLLKDISPLDASPGSPASLTPVGSRLYFTANDADHGNELWVTGGGASAPELVSDIFPGPGYSNPSELTAVGDRLFFIARDRLDHQQLWVTGPAGAVSPLMTIGEKSVYYRGTAALGNRLILALYDHEAQRAHLWRSDGTPAGTQPFFDGLSAHGDLLSAGGWVYISGKDLAGQVGLWQTDGTAQGTLRIPLPASAAQYSTIAQLTMVNSTLFFFAYGPQTTGLYRVNAGHTGVELVQSFARAEASPGPYNTLVDLAGRLVIRVQKLDYSMALYVSDGTPSGTRLISAQTGFVDWLTPLGPYLFFARTGAADGTELWRWDGTRAEPVRIMDINPGPGSADPAGLLAVGTRLYFSANDGLHGSELWAYDVPLRRLWLPVVGR